MFTELKLVLIFINLKNTPWKKELYSGARADEVANVIISDISILLVPKRNYSSVRIRGKGNKERFCPLEERTVNELLPFIVDRDTSQHVFLNRSKNSLTRFGITLL